LLLPAIFAFISFSGLSIFLRWKMNAKVEIGPKCTHKDCKQGFNFSNFQLAVYLYGVFFLVKKSTPEEKRGKSYIGFTCPKCLRTNIHAHSYNDIFKIKSELSTKMIEIFKSEKNDNGEIQNILISSFLPDLKYYSPFMLNSEHLDSFNIEHYGCSTSLQDDHISNVISNYIDEKKPELKDKFCSFVSDSKAPADMFSVIYWYNEKDIEACLYFEHKHNVRMFPRYYFYTDLVEKMDSLLRYNYFMGKPFEQAKENHTIERTKDLETLKAYASENNINYENIIKGDALNEPEALIKIIEENRKQIAKDSESSAKFLNMLVSDPLPLGGSISTGHCDYLWRLEDPFYENELPDIFIDAIGDDELQLLVEQRLGEHSKIADLVLENRTKQYVQEFLESKLIPFIENYEKLMRIDNFLYAKMWKLKEEYLKMLYDKTMNGLSEDLPNVMKKEGKGWTIRFNGGIPKRALTDRGFRWIYIILSQPKQKKIHYSTMSDIYESNKSKWDKNKDHYQYSSNSEKIITSMIKNDDKPLSLTKKMSQQNLADPKMLEAIKNKIENKLGDIITANHDSDFETVRMLKKKLNQSKKQLEECGIKWKIDETKNVVVTSDKFDNKITSTTDGGSIKKAYDRALEKIKPIDKDLYTHFSTYIRKEKGAFIYDPPEDFDWHLI